MQNEMKVDVYSNAGYNEKLSVIKSVTKNLQGSDWILLNLFNENEIQMMDVKDLFNKILYSGTSHLNYIEVHENNATSKATRSRVNFQ